MTVFDALMATVIAVIVLTGACALILVITERKTPRGDQRGEGE